jgi:hypothetical protein
MVLLTTQSYVVTNKDLSKCGSILDEIGKGSMAYKENTQSEFFLCKVKLQYNFLSQMVEVLTLLGHQYSCCKILAYYTNTLNTTEFLNSFEILIRHH